MKKHLFTLFLAMALGNGIVHAQYNMGMDFDDEAYAQVPKKATLTRSLAILPESSSLKMYAPLPGYQSVYGTCTSWAIAYCGRTMVEAIKNNWTDRNMITARAYSPAFLFRMLEPDDAKCEGGSSISEALDALKTEGVVMHSEIDALCLAAIDPNHLENAQAGKVKDYLRLFERDATPEHKVQSIKKSISEKKPIAFGMNCPPSFMRAKEVWSPSEDPELNYGGHAMCVIGYDDTKYGGAFEVQNSWSTAWGDEGYTWIKYADFANFAKYAYELVDLPEAKENVKDLSGSIALHLADGNSMPIERLQLTRGLEIVPALRESGPFTTYTSLTSYPSGTRFRISINNDQPAYVYALSSDLSNEIIKIFPHEAGISAALTDRQNTILIPDLDHYIAFDDRPGTDYLCVLYSKDELNFDDLIKQISLQTGTFSEKIVKVTGHNMVNPKDIQFESSSISFKGSSHGKSIIPLIVELNHH